jgi:transcriptional regulator with GAF, ATPase, and Fis domain
MGNEDEASNLLARAGSCLEAWDVTGARAAAEGARAAASVWGDANGVAHADILLARAALLVSAAPIDSPLTAPARRDAAETPTVIAARYRLAVELQCARADTQGPLPPAPDLGPVAPPDLGAAACMVAVATLGDPAKLRKVLAGVGETRGAADFGGWAHLLAALDAESRGASCFALLDAARAQADEEGNRALAWSTLRARFELCEHRGANEEAQAARQALVKLVEQWALTLTASDARSALSRPDRSVYRRAAPTREGDQTSWARRLIDGVVALAEERDAERVTQAALNEAIAITGAERGILILLDPSGDHRVAASQHVGSMQEEALVGLSATIARRALRDGEVVLANEVKRDPRFSECASLALEVSSVLCAPIHARGQIEGAIYLDRRRGGKPFDDSAVAAARALGAMLAASLLNARTIAALTDRSRELEAAREELSITLASRTVERDDISRRLAAIEDVVPSGGSAIVGRSPPMLRMRRMIQMVAGSDAPVLIWGETGSGKELVARAVHDASGRRDRPFVAVNCGGLSENLLESELFGAERGAYTSANSSRPGLFVAAHSGTLFMDEVGDMPPSMQTALLRVLETSEVRPVGATKARTVDVRVLVASHRDLLELVRKGLFRDDLRYRLEVIRIEVPALRDRLDDLPELCEHLLRDARRRYNLPDKRLAPAAIHVLGLRRWPGNVRELKHALVGAALAAQGPVIGPEDIPAERAADAGAAESQSLDAPEAEVDGHALRADSLRRALKATAGNRGKAAKLLGISRSTFYRYLESYGIAADSVPPPPDEEVL